MSIISFIDKISAQTATYWANPVSDGYGGWTYDTPVEIKCRWDDVAKIINNDKGEEVISNAEIITNAELQEGELLYLGTLTEVAALADESGFPYELLSDQVYPYPKQIDRGVHKIVTKGKTPLIKSSTKFVKMYYLKPNWETKL